jgi:hypothetical protein
MIGLSNSDLNSYIHDMVKALFERDPLKNLNLEVAKRETVVIMCSN